MAEIVTGAHSSGSDGRPPTTRTKIAIAAGIGTLIESYDFFLYGVASALVFARVFFPSLGPAAGTVAAFATFAVAYFVRPLGGVVFGYVGDRFGRTTALTWTLLIMGGATVGVGLLPDAPSHRAADRQGRGVVWRFQNRNWT